MTAHDQDLVTDQLTGTATTQHEWDGIEELDTPLPRWWLYTFYICIVWGIAYTIAFPAWPLIGGQTDGVLGFSSRAEVAASIEAQIQANAEISDRIAATDFKVIANDTEMDSFARAGGAAIFRTYCSQCHGAGAAGVVGGYPNLLDDDWLWGGDHEAIATTIRHGIRWDDDEDTRWSQMPAFGRDEILSKAEIESVAEHVLSWSGRAEKNQAGATLYAENCASCHGDEGLGDREQGAPSLADAIWLYGSGREDVVTSITNARFGVMPAWSARLTEAQIRQVTHYVHGLGGGE
ncbi:MAG: cytochrome-c oxidase, cbb3-type subunit III [Pseudomonadota bacterium]